MYIYNLQKKVVAKSVLEISLRGTVTGRWVPTFGANTV